MKTVISCFILICVLFTGCNANSQPARISEDSNLATDDPVSRSTALDSLAQDDSPALNLHYFGMHGSQNEIIAQNGAGAYYILPHTDKYANIMYLDFASYSSMPLCSRPECEHSDDTCNSYLAWRGGYPSLAVNDTSLLLIHGNAGEFNLDRYGDAALPHVQAMELNGENRHTLCQFSASEDLNMSIACDNEFIYCIFSRMEGAAKQMTLGRISLTDGTFTELAPLPDGSNFLQDADKNFLTVVNYPLPESGDMYAPTTSAVFLFYDAAKGKETARKVIEYTPDSDEPSVQFCVKGTKLYTYSPPQDSVTVEDISTGEHVYTKTGIFNRGVKSCQILDVLQSRVILEVCFDDKPEEVLLYWLDCASGTVQQFSQTGRFEGPIERTFPILPSCIMGSKLISIYKYEMDTMILESPAGGTMEVGEMIPCYGVISAEDYWSGKMNYTPFA